MAVAFGLKNCIWLCAAFFSEAGFLLTKYVMSLQETKMRGGYFAWELAHEEKIHLESCKD